jgi:tetratricopeptide (TPR) repeat protein
MSNEYTKRADRLQQVIILNLDEKMKKAREDVRSAGNGDELHAQRRFRELEADFRLASATRPTSRPPPSPLSPLQVGIPTFDITPPLATVQPPASRPVAPSWWQFPLWGMDSCALAEVQTCKLRAVGSSEAARDRSYAAYRRAVELEKRSLDTGVLFRSMDMLVRRRNWALLGTAELQILLGDVSLSRGAEFPAQSAQRPMFFSQSNSHYESARDVVSDTLGASHLALVPIFCRLGTMHFVQESYNDAARWFQKALLLQIRHLGHDHVDVSRIGRNIGGCAQENKDYELARALYTRATQVQDVWDYRHDEITEIYVKGLAALELEVEDMTEARLVCTKALEFADENAAPALVRSVCSVLADVSMRQEIYEDACHFFEREAASLGETEKVKTKQTRTDWKFADAEVTFRKNGNAHSSKSLLPEALRDYNLRQGRASRGRAAKCAMLLGDIKLGEGALVEGRQLYAQAYHTCEVLFGDGSVEMIAPCRGLGYILCREKQWVEASRLYRRSLDITSKKLGARHLDCASLHMQCGGIEEERGQYEVAKNHLYLVISILEKAGPPNDLALAEAYISLGSVLMLNDLLEEARSSFAEAIRMRTLTLGDGHVDVTRLKHNLDFLYATADVLRQFNNIGGAKSLLYGALHGFLEKREASHPKVEKCVVKLAEITFAEGMLNKKRSTALLIESKRLYHRLLDITVSSAGELSRSAAQIHRKIGLIDERHGDIEAAERSFEIELGIHRSLELPGELVDNLVCLGEVASALGKFSKARLRLENALKLMEEVGIATCWSSAQIAHKRSRVVAKLASLPIESRVRAHRKAAERRREPHA